MLYLDNTVFLWNTYCIHPPKDWFYRSDVRLRNLHSEHISKALVQQGGFVLHLEDQCIAGALLFFFPGILSALYPDLRKSTLILWDLLTHLTRWMTNSFFVAECDGDRGRLSIGENSLLSSIFTICSCQGEKPKRWRDIWIDHKNSLHGLRKGAYNGGRLNLESFWCSCRKVEEEGLGYLGQHGRDCRVDADWKSRKHGFKQEYRDLKKHIREVRTH